MSGVVAHSKRHGIRDVGVVKLLLWVCGKSVWGFRGCVRIFDVVVRGYDVVSFVVPEGKGIEIIRSGAFRWCMHLESVTLPRGLIRIERFAFADCYYLTSLTLPRGLTTIDPYAFCGCVRLTTVTLPHGLTTIGIAAFQNCEKITSINLPSGLTTIGEYAFWGCRSLTSVKLPHSLINVGRSAFASCPSLTSVVFRPPVSRAAFHAWVVGNSRNRSNWELTTLQHTHNVLRLITAMTLWTRDVTCVDPDGSKFVFSDCNELKTI